MRNTIRFYVISLFLVLGTLFTSCSGQVNLMNDHQYGGDKLPGNWVGNQKVTIRYESGTMKFRFVKSTEEVPTVMRIDENGNISGHIGGAEFKDARIIKNRGFIFRSFNWATDYAVVGKLEGPMFPEDSIAEKKISIPLYFKNNTLHGDVFHKPVAIDLYPMGSVMLQKN